MKLFVLLAVLAASLTGCCVEQMNTKNGGEPAITLISKENQIMTRVTTKKVEGIRVKKVDEPKQDYTAKHKPCSGS